MEKIRKGRSRSKSTNSLENDAIASTENANASEETAPNLNGDKYDIEKEVESIVGADVDNDNNHKENDISENNVDESLKDDPTSKGRKRKASEMRSEDENANEESINEKEGEDKSTSDSVPPINDLLAEVKEEPLSIDGEVDNIPTKQTLGKGKRARIPNKRYSEILLSPKGLVKSAENGSERIESENEMPMDISIKLEPLSPAITSLKSRTSSGSPMTPLKKQKMTVDLSDLKYLKPFDYGWKRELVWRATNDTNSKRNGDIYYYTPIGKKVRSMREVAEYLTNKELSLDNFTFFKDALGIDDPEKEIIRDAKKGSSTPIARKPVAKPPQVKTPRPQKLVPSPKIMSPKLPSPKVYNPRVSLSKLPTNQTADSPSPLLKSKATPRGLGNFKIKLSAKKDKKQPKVEENMKVETTPVKSTPNRKSAKWSNFNEGNKPCQPCSIRCEGVHGLVPTLQCRLCLCLYHHECVGLAPQLTLPYICKNCHLESQGQIPEQPTPIAPPPPLTPINSLKSAVVQSTNVLPKLQRIPRSEDPCTSNEIVRSQTPIAELPKLIPRPVHIHPATISSPVKASESSGSENNKSLVGSVTTWLPHNSKIVDNIQETSEEPNNVSRPQYVEFLGGRKFLVIPKHNFMTVSPTAAATAVSNLEQTKDTDVIDTSVKVDSASLGSDSLPFSKPEPESPSKPENSQTTEAMEVDSPPTEPVAAMDVDERSGEDGKVLDVSQPTPSPAKPKKRTVKVSSITKSEEKEENKLMDLDWQNVSYAYNTLLYVFQYLKVQDLLRAGCVCTMWRDIASHSMLWRTVRMKNSQVHSFDGLANTLKKHSTRHLDLRKMLLPTGGDEIWPEFSKAIEKVDTLRRIELCRCPADVVEKLAVSNPQLEVINAVTIKCESMDLEPLKALTNIKELRVKSTGGLTVTSNIDSLKHMKALKHLSLTSIRDLDSMNLNVLAELSNLESLDLGECTDFPKNFGSEILSKLDKLEKLRLEKGQGTCATFEILEAVKDMSRLEQLELVNFDIKAGFDKALGACQNIKKLLIIPTYISQSATTNHMVLGGVLRLQKTLSHFVWGVTLELLRVTELFVDQCEEPEKKEKKEKKAAGNGDSIPVLKPVPLLGDRDTEIPPAHDPPQVEILALPSLQKLLMQNLPTTRVKILKIPFHATWRQSITDSVN